MYKEIAQLKMKCSKYEESLKVVDWYIGVFENGMDTRGMAEELVKQANRYKKLDNNYEKLKENSKDKIKKLKREL